MKRRKERDKSDKNMRGDRKLVIDSISAQAPILKMSNSRSFSARTWLFEFEFLLFLSTIANGYYGLVGIALFLYIVNP